MERNSNVFKFQGSNMIVSAKGPNIDRHMNMSTSFRSNLLSSTMNMPLNFEKRSSAASVVSQRSLYYGRETSPTGSVRSDIQPRNFHQSFYQKGFPQKSVYSGRGGSPVSLRSIDSSASLATDIVQAINNGNFNRQEWKMIQQAFSRSNRRKYEYRKKAERRRKMKMYFKNLRNGDDSGEQGSNSSISSDDCRSTRTGYSHRYDRNYKENIPRSTTRLDCRSEDIFQKDSRETYGYSEIDLQNPYQRNIGAYNRENNYQKDSQLGNMYTNKNFQTYNKSTLYSQNNSMSGPLNTFSSQKHVNGQANLFSAQKSTLNTSICSTKSLQNVSMMSQRDRFKGGFQLPSQKFNKSSTLHEEHDQVRGFASNSNKFPSKECANNRRILREDQIDEHSDENDNIFLDTTTKPKPVAKKSETRQKRKVESLSDIPISSKKKPKITTSTKAKETTPYKNKNEDHDFEFIKPQFPIRKSAPAKPREKLISKSTGAPDLVFNDQEKQNPASEPVEPAPAKPREKLISKSTGAPDLAFNDQEKQKPASEPIEPVAPASPEPDVEPELAENTQLTNSDISMRPSFMKRKLFTQTLDVTEKKNNSSDSLGTDSPQSNIYSALCREKHKTRKLVTSQSLLNRDLNQDDNNLLDLIHKIVPANQVNATITANNTKSFNSRLSGNNNADSDKWDITSLISTCNNESVSETYTDDEIFKVADDDKKNKPQEKSVVKRTTPQRKNKVLNDEIETFNIKQSKIVLVKLPTPKVPKMQTPVKSCPAKKVILPRNNIDEFWNTDVESDYESVDTPRRQNEINLPEQTSSRVESNTENRPTNLLTKITRTCKTHESSPKVVNKNDTTLVQVLKKQTNKKMSSISQETTLKKSNDVTKSLKNTNDDTKKLKKSNDDKNTLNKANDDATTLNKANDVKKAIKKSSDNIKALKKSNEDAKTLKKTNNNTTQQNEKPDKPRKGTPTILLKTRRQINLSATLGSVKKPCVDKKGLSPKKVASIKNKTSPNIAIKNKPNNEKKATQEKHNKTKTIQKKQNDSQHHNNSSNQLEETPQSQGKVTKVLNSVGSLNDTILKSLRSRTIDLSSSFNSEKFELTMSRARKSRTPSKRISFNKSKNLLTNNKTRSRATKA